MPSEEPEEHSKGHQHRNAAPGLQIPDNNSTSWPVSHLLTHLQLRNMGHFTLLPDEGKGSKTSAWELSLQVRKQQFMAKIFLP